MFPIETPVLDRVISELQICDVTTATIRQICALSDALEQEAGEKFVHLEIGNPGLPASQVGVEAEKAALDSGIANKYPAITGLPSLKNAGARFLKAFLDVDES